ncbi:MAG: methylamine dehydrogenase (amicyanin) light chain [Rhizobiales bacterium]|nr:methylamine dehydrogenase (amicyanin) light chain [Hyphomicrobiales bacterium]
MKFLDKFIEGKARKMAQSSSRRSFLTKIGTVAVGASVIPLLPVHRAHANASTGSAYPGVGTQTTGNPQDPGDPTSCDYWRYCAIDGFLCTCCGGTASACPPGSEMSPITWIGTCQNPADNRNYIISYNDCCGKSSCGRCLCNRNEGDRPMVRPQVNNDINWCLGTESQVYHCSTAVLIGVAIDG